MAPRKRAKERDSVRRPSAATIETRPRRSAPGVTASPGEGGYRLLFQANPHPMWVYDLETLAFLAVNNAAVEAYGYGSDEFLGMTIADIRPSEDLPRLKRNVAAVTDGLDQAGTWRHRKKDGTIFDVEIVSHAVTYEGRKGELVLARDITQRVRIEARLRYVTRLYALLGEINEAIVRIPLRDDLLQAICDVAIEFGRFRMAWIGMVDPRHGVLRPVAETGHVDGYSGLHGISVRDEPSGRGPTGQAVRSGTLTICDDIATDPRMAPWRDEALARGYRSSAAIPFRVGDEVIGALSLYAAEPGFFTADERRLLEKIGADVSFALAAFERERERAVAFEARLESERKYRALFDTMPQGVIYQGTDGSIVAANPAAERILGLSLSQMQGRTSLDPRWRATREDGSPFPGAEHPAMVALRTGRAMSNVVMGVFHPGTEGQRWILVGAVPEFRPEESRPVGVFATFADITDLRKAEQAARVKDQVFEVSLAANSVSDVAGRLTEANRAFVATWGFDDKREVLGHDIAELLNDPNETAAIIAALEESGGWQGTFAARRKDGSTFTAFGLATTLLDDRGAKIGYQSSVLDITERKKAEEALQASEEQLRVIFETSPAGIILVDGSGTIVFANGRMAELLGRPRERLIGTRYVDHLHESEREIGNTRMRQLIEDEVSSVSTERRYVRADGGSFWGYLSGRRLEHPDGTLRALVGIIADVTERKQAETALRESEERLKLALDGSNDGLWDIRLDRGSIYLSPRGSEILGWRSEDLGRAASAWKAFVHPDDVATTDGALKAYLEGRVPLFTVEQRLKTASGDWKWILTRGKAVERASDGSPTRMVGTHTDITDRRELELQLLQAQKMESVGRLAGGVAHDFNNQLMVILGYAEQAMEREAPGGRLRHELEEIRKAALRSADLTRSLLGFARRQTTSPKVLDLNAEVAGTLAMLRRLIGEDIDLAWRPGEALRRVRMDPSQLGQVLTNLCVNARDAIAGVGRITIETASVHFDRRYCSEHPGFRPGAFLMLAVSDDGSGMDAETKAHLFEPFYTTKGVGRGTGLGLAMVYGIVKQNDGLINVYSEPAEGTTIRIYLPEFAGEEAGRSDAMAEASPLGRGEAVLVVEDEPAVRLLAVTMLQKLGYVAHEAASPEEALRMARERAGGLQLLITDVVMPGMNGRELADRLRSEHPGLKTLFMSGYTADVIAHRGILEEGVHFLQKPFSVQDLAQRVQEALGVD